MNFRRRGTIGGPGGFGSVETGWLAPRITITVGTWFPDGLVSRSTVTYFSAPFQMLRGQLLPTFANGRLSIFFPILLRCRNRRAHCMHCMCSESMTKLWLLTETNSLYRTSCNRSLSHSPTLCSRTCLQDPISCPWPGRAYRGSSPPHISLACRNCQISNLSTWLLRSQEWPGFVFVLALALCFL